MKLLFLVPPFSFSFHFFTPLTCIDALQTTRKCLEPDHYVSRSERAGGTRRRQYAIEAAYLLGRGKSVATE